MFLREVDVRFELCDGSADGFDFADAFVAENHVFVDVVEICATDLWAVLVCLLCRSWYTHSTVCDAESDLVGLQALFARQRSCDSNALLRTLQHLDFRCEGHVEG